MSVAAVAMPDVAGLTLDVALADIEGAGFGDEVHVEGGGAFGVVIESNWTVCEQAPAAGASVAGAPVLTVGRECEGAAPDTSMEVPMPVSETAADTPEAVSVETSSRVMPVETTGPTIPAATLPTGPLTVESSGELAALLALPDYCDDSIGPFAVAHAGQTLEFDGSVANVIGDGVGPSTVLVVAADDGDPLYPGPAFQFREVTLANLNLTGENAPGSITAGLNIRVLATIDRYNADQCLFYLVPIATTVR